MTHVNGECTVLTTINPAAFIDLAKGSRDPEWVAMEANITEEMSPLPAYEHMANGVRVAMDIFTEQAVNAHNMVIKCGNSMSNEAVIERNFNRGLNAGYSTAMSTMNRIIKDLENSLTALNKRKKV